MKKVIGVLVLVSVFIFTPLMCLIAWNSWASAFGLPTFSFWHWFATSIAIHSLLAATRIDPKDGD